MNYSSIYYILSIFIFASNCLASPYVDATLLPAVLTKASPYAIQLNIEKNDISCSGTIVSPDGYVLTALHCIASCLTNPMIEKTIVLPSGQIATGVELSRSPRNYCDFGQQLGQAEVIALGTTKMIETASMQKVALFSMEDFVFLKKLGFTAPAGSGDFAILKLQNMSSLQCAKISRRPLIENETIWSLSFPKFAREENNSIKGQAYYTEGLIKFNFFEVGSFYSNLYNDPGMFWSTTDAEGGSSGSAVYSTESDEILGIFVSSVKRQNSYREGSTKNISITEIVRILKLQIGAEKTDRIFSCK